MLLEQLVHLLKAGKLTRSGVEFKIKQILSKIKQILSKIKAVQILHRTLLMVHGGCIRINFSGWSVDNLYIKSKEGYDSRRPTSAGEWKRGRHIDRYKVTWSNYAGKETGHSSTVIVLYVFGCSCCSVNKSHKFLNVQNFGVPVPGSQILKFSDG